MRNKPYPYYEMPGVRTIKELVSYGVSNYASNKLVDFKVGKTVRSKTYGEFALDTDALGSYLFHLGLRDCKIALLGENSYNWYMSFVSILNGANVCVPLDKEMPADDLLKFVKICECKAIIYSDTYNDVIEKFKSSKELSIEHYIPMSALAECIFKGEDLLDDGYPDYVNATVLPDDLACVVFTSGTTGKSKGVMLTHENLTSDVVSTCECTKGGNTVIVLPFNHTFSWASALFAAFLMGASGYICSDLKDVVGDFKKYAPQNFSAVPLVIEMIYKTIWSTAEKQGKAKMLKRGIKISNMLLSKGIDIRRKLFKEIIDNLGGNLETIICGGAALDPMYQKGLFELGINVINGYGITECSPVVTVNRNDYFRLGSCGQALPCNHIKISDPDIDGVGEVYVKGSNVMKGYYNEPEETEKSFDNGWFKTGDYGKIDEDGFLYITGRKKNLIILANGKNVSPEEIEEKLSRYDFVNEVLVYEENGAITAEFFLNTEEFTDAKQQAKQAVKKYNVSAPAYKHIANIKYRDTEFPKTTTLKIKRNYAKKEIV
ncbi:MAG: AMP-binding protein [Acutalibacteraceae bacterium]